MNETQTRPNQNYIDNNRAQSLLEKWSPVLDYTSDKVSSIDNANTRLNTAILLENQEEWCIREANTGGATGGASSAFGSGAGGSSINQGGGDGGYATGDNYAANDARLPKILIPMIRRTFPELITNEIVGVQPMSGPVGLAFALRYKYSNAKISDGSARSNLGSGPSVGGSAAKGSAGVTGELGHNNLDSGFTGASASALVAAQGTAADLNAETTVNAAHWLSAGFNATDSGFAAALSAFELDNAKDAGSVELSFEKTAVEAGTRRLNARWSVELEQDLKNMNGIDVDAELTNAMFYEIQAEIDQEMIVRMIKAATGAGQGVGYSI